MSTLANWFGFATSSSRSGALPDIFPIGIKESIFVQADVTTMFTKILIDVIERTQGIPEDVQPMLWDNCVMSESSQGLVTLLACAMTEKKDLFLVYNPSLKLLRQADSVEAQVIQQDYRAKGESTVGVFISFTNFLVSDMIRFYSALEYCTVAALNKQMNLSKAIQFKMNDLRSSVGLTDSAKAEAQVNLMAEELSAGRDIYLDAKDIVEVLKPDLTAVKEAMLFLDAKRCFYLGMPMSYVTGEAPKGLGDSGEGDSKAVERGLKTYYFRIIKPVLEAIFDTKTTFKSQDFRQLDGALNALKIFSLVDEEFISKDNKLLIINKLLDVDSKLGKADPPPPVVVNPNAPPVDPNKKPAPPKANF